MKPPVRLEATAHKKIWGSPDTEPWYANPKRNRVGEIWFQASDSVPLLVKLLFTSDKLSVQVHPGDEYAGKHHNSPGKTEMWHILRAEPGAKVALGIRENLTEKQLKEAAKSGEIEGLLDWIPAHPRDTFFVPAGTIHAIGAGLTLCEVQQYSNVTYRIYDYGRRRRLHLKRALEVSHLEARKEPPRCKLPIDCAYFKTLRLDVNGVWVSSSPARNTLYIALEGEGFFAGEPFRAGHAWEVEAGSEPFEIKARAAAFLITAQPDQRRPNPISAL